MKWYGWKPYVPVAERRAMARRHVEQLRKQGMDIRPIEIEGRKIARTFWGEAWCKHLESYSDYENRLPRGRTYVRNGSVFHLEIAKGEVHAQVSGSSIYRVDISIKTLPRKRWSEVKKKCAGRVGSLLELLQGRLSDQVMSVVTDRDAGLFPGPREIGLNCSCPDWAVMCKHVAAVLYGVGARFDHEPELLFLLRGVDHQELVADETTVVDVTTRRRKGRKRLTEDALEDIFGIDLTTEVDSDPSAMTDADASASRALKKKTKAGKKKASASGKSSAKTGKKTGAAAAKKAKSRSGSPPKAGMKKTRDRFSMTGDDVYDLRMRFEMYQDEFAELLGVSISTVSLWEGKERPLKLRARSRETLKWARKLSKRKAWRELEEI